MDVDDDTAILVLAPFEGHWQLFDQNHPSRDARVVRANCGHLSLLSPQGEAYLEQNACYTMCSHCQHISAAPDGEPRITVPGAVAAAKAALPPAEHARLLRYMQQMGIKDSDA